MKTANKKNLREHAQVLLGNNYSPEREAALITEALTGFERTHGHISHDQAAHLEKLDSILGNYGVESDAALDILYSNTGDSYGSTLLYHEGKLLIGDWGTIAEMA